LQQGVIVNRYSTISAFRFLLCAVAVVLLSAGAALGAEKGGQGEEVLLHSYQRYAAELHKSSLGVPLVLKSYEHDDKAHVDIYGIFDYPFEIVADALKNPANWCDIAVMNPNVKTCTYGQQGGDRLLTFYVGRKGYKTPEEARRVINRFKVAQQREGYLDIALAADAGLYGIKNYRMRFEAAPVAAGKTFVRVGFEYSDSVALRMTEKAYYATLGRNKTGFTVIGADETGKPILVGGRRGAIERNTVRYYFAIRSFIKMLRFPAEQRFSRSIGEWYDLTARYSQLDFGLNRKEYVDIKTRERRNQLTLQQRIGTGLSDLGSEKRGRASLPPDLPITFSVCRDAASTGTRSPAVPSCVG
jgi:hypothetical protein